MLKKNTVAVVYWQKLGKAMRLPSITLSVIQIVSDEVMMNARCLSYSVIQAARHEVLLTARCHSISVKQIVSDEHEVLLIV